MTEAAFPTRVMEIWNGKRSRVDNASTQNSGYFVPSYVTCLQQVVSEKLHTKTLTFLFNSMHSLIEICTHSVVAFVKKTNDKLPPGRLGSLAVVKLSSPRRVLIWLRARTLQCLHIRTPINGHVCKCSWSRHQYKHQRGWRHNNGRTFRMRQSPLCKETISKIMWLIEKQIAESFSVTQHGHSRLMRTDYDDDDENINPPWV